MSAPVIFGGQYQSKIKLLFNCLSPVTIWRLSRLLFLSIIPPVYHDILAIGFSPSFEKKWSYCSLFVLSLSLSHTDISIWQSSGIRNALYNRTIWFLQLSSRQPSRDRLWRHWFSRPWICHSSVIFVRQWRTGCIDWWLLDRYCVCWQCDSMQW